MRAIVVDWSGRLSKEADAIWLAECVDGQFIRLESGRSRVEVVAELVRSIGLLRSQQQRCLIGLDFSFSFPAWFVAQHGCTSATDLWPLVKLHGEDWLHECAPPFWGRPAKSRPLDDPRRPQFRATENETESVSGIRPKSTFQIGGAGSVGTGSIRGMPFLSDLQQAGAAIWPFDQPQHWATVCEVYPRLWTGPVTKSSRGARRKYLEDRQINAPDYAIDSVINSEDAFDAFISALMISLQQAGPQPVENNTKPESNIVQLEGKIFAPGPQRLNKPGTVI
jgi:hypothetical protein